MKKHLLIISIAIAAIAACSNNSSEQLDQFKIDGSLQIKLLASSLKKELISSMQTNGPASAVSVCNIKAPEITNQVNSSSTIKIKRTSLKLRNHNNTADDWEYKILTMFAKQHAEGVPVSDILYSEQIDKNGTSMLRMMKAIPVQAVCLTCHGNKQQITEEVSNILMANYPNDEATGYTIGDLRGAFSISQIIEK